MENNRFKEEWKHINDDADQNSAIDTESNMWKQKKFHVTIYVSGWIQFKKIISTLDDSKFERLHNEFSEFKNKSEEVHIAKLKYISIKENTSKCTDEGLELNVNKNLLLLLYDIKTKGCKRSMGPLK